MGDKDVAFEGIEAQARLAFQHSIQYSASIIYFMIYYYDIN